MFATACATECASVCHGLCHGVCHGSKKDMLEAKQRCVDANTSVEMTMACLAGQTDASVAAQQVWKMPA